MTNSYKMTVVVVLLFFMGGLAYIYMQQNNEDAVQKGNEDVSLNNEVSATEQEVTHAALQEVNTQADFEKLLSFEDKPIIVKFSTDWCPPCKALKPIFKVVSEIETKNARFAAVNVDTFANQDFLGQFGIQSIPTIIVFVKGKEVDRIRGLPKKDGLTHKQALRKELEKHWAAAQ